jgi:hypothetical protein
MNRLLRSAIAASSLAAFTVALPAVAQSPSDPHQHEEATQAGKGPQGMGGMGMGGQGMGMMDMMQGCRQMMQGGGGHSMPHLPPGNEKLELQMHADMMRAMSDILSKYAARLPERK